MSVSHLFPQICDVLQNMPYLPILYCIFGSTGINDEKSLLLSWFLFIFKFSVILRVGLVCRDQLSFMLALVFVVNFWNWLRKQ